MIKNPELRIQMAKADREKYEKEFTLEIFEKKLQHILNQFLSQTN